MYKEIELKKDSWHFWLAKNFGNLYSEENEEVYIDFCEYSGKVIKGLCFFLITLILTGLALFVILNSTYYSILWVVECLRQGVIVGVFSPWQVPGAFFTGLIVVSGLGWVILKLINLCGKTVYKITHNRMDFISLLFRTVKEKTCIYINLK